MRLADFNETDAAEAVAVLRPCVDVTRWCDEIVAHRPFASVDELIAVAEGAASPFDGAEIEAALAHHPRIGERADGDSREASMSRSEQSGVDPADAAVQDALREGNRAYEDRFGRVFLIRAAGRAADEILSSLRTRLTHTDDQEQHVVAQQLREIALLRLKGVITA